MPTSLEVPLKTGPQNVPIYGATFHQESYAVPGTETQFLQRQILKPWPMLSWLLTLFLVKLSESFENFTESRPNKQKTEKH